jgi:hypothetical protein
MKQFYGWAIGLFTLFLVSFTPYYYSIEEVVSAMRSGNANLLSKYFDERVDISLPGKNDNYSKSQGELILKDFFSNNDVLKISKLNIRAKTMDRSFVLECYKRKMELPYQTLYETES